MKRYTITINKNNNNNFSFRPNNASEALDNLILSNMKKMNPYIKTNNTIDAMIGEASFGNDRILINSSYLKDNFDSEFIKAANFLSNYIPSEKKYYILSDGTPIEFFEDEIQIGYDLIPLYKLSSPKYYSTLSNKTKNIIINLFISINR